MPDKTCFVVQGFGIKTDFTNGRKINLDASYLVIKEAVEEAGLECIRADEIKHSGTIDEPMYRKILEADLVICDLSTYNVNAAYELGVRYALRRSATIIVAESEFKNPFDFSHIVIRNYKHLGDDIGLQEARRFQQELIEAIATILIAEQIDSPVYTFLPQLQPPTLSQKLIESAPFEMQSQRAVPDNWRSGVSGAGSEAVKALMDQAEQAMRKSDFVTAKALFDSVLEKRPEDAYVIQQKALATYKSELPDLKSALMEARSMLKMLMPETSHDAETLGLWAAVHKRLWSLTNELSDLEQAIFAVQKGFILQNDYYNGINLAYLLNIRASFSNPADAITDFVLANRIRKQVVNICENLLTAHKESAESTTAEPKTAQEQNLKQKELDEQYWICATLWEAWEGIGDAAEVEKWKNHCADLASAQWMFETTKNQIGNLKQLLAKESPLKFINT